MSSIVEQVPYRKVLAQIRLRAGTKEEWSSNPILGLGEPGALIEYEEVDGEKQPKTVAIKIGDGKTPWDKLVAATAYVPEFRIADGVDADKFPCKQWQVKYSTEEKWETLGSSEGNFYSLDVDINPENLDTWKITTTVFCNGADYNIPDGCELFIEYDYNEAPIEKDQCRTGNGDTYTISKNVYGSQIRIKAILSKGEKERVLGTQNIIAGPAGDFTEDDIIAMLQGNGDVISRASSTVHGVVKIPERLMKVESGEITEIEGTGHSHPIEYIDGLKALSDGNGNLDKEKTKKQLGLSGKKAEFDENGVLQDDDTCSYFYGETSLKEGVSALPEGKLYFMYRSSGNAQ